MPEILTLHLQTQGGAAPRVMALPNGPVRVGRGLRCEVRLGDPELAEVECILRMRGDAWYVQPIASPGRVSIDGRAVRHLRVLPPGVTLRVGDQDLTLRLGANPAEGPGSYSEPIPVEAGPRAAAREPVAAPAPVPAPRPQAPRVVPASRFAPPGRAARAPYREEWDRPTADGRAWEARWRAAAASLQARATPRAEPPVAPPEPESDDAAAFEAPPIEPLDPPVATEPEPEPIVLPMVRTLEPADLASALEVAVAPSSPEAVVSATTEVVAWDLGDAAEVTVGIAEAIEVAVVTEVPAPVAEQPPPARPELVEAPPSPPVEAPSVVVEEPAPIAAEAPVVTAPKRPRPSRRAATADRPGASRSEPALPELDDLEWPSARVILAASRSDRPARGESRPASPRRDRFPGPTEAREPGHWAPSLKLAWLPVALATGLLAAAGLKLAYGWGEDAREAGLIADRLLRPEGPGPDGAADAVIHEDAPWWGTTSGHLALKAAALGSAPKGDPARDEQVAFLLDAARKASPLETASRSARARLEDGSGDGLVALGLSRDIVTLSLTARRLAEGGDPDAALKAYRGALELAAGAELARNSDPIYLDGPDARRFALPNEELVAGVIRAMASRADWPYARWSVAIPDHGLVLLATYRVLREREGSAEADAVLDRILALDASDAAGDPLRGAARAEALALKGRYDEAAEGYRGAIAGLDDEPTRRAWYLNLAEILARTGERDKILDALTAARAGRGDDEIGERVGSVLLREGLREGPASRPASPSSQRLRAN